MTAETLPTAVYAKLSAFFADTATGILGAFLALIVVLLFFAIGYIVAWIITTIVRKAMDEFEIEEKIAKQGITPTLGKYTLTTIINFFLTLYIIFLFLGQATEIVSLGYFSTVILWVLAYLPGLAQGILIVVAALLFARYIGDMIIGKKELAMAESVAFVIKVFVGYMALVIALPMFLPGVDISILQQAFVLFVAAVSVALGVGVAIALGWGLKDPIAISAKKHQQVFDGFFERLEAKPTRVAAKKRR
ncbi:MAG: hypothetical protein JXA43_03100 [Candidatus Diapherotrites archaeon]|nr:hypothetical protein [Candidatus Diapherotrites archaeon]